MNDQLTINSVSGRELFERTFVRLFQARVRKEHPDCITDYEGELQKIDDIVYYREKAKMFKASTSHCSFMAFKEDSTVADLIENIYPTFNVRCGKDLSVAIIGLEYHDQVLDQMKGGTLYRYKLIWYTKSQKPKAKPKQETIMTNTTVAQLDNDIVELRSKLIDIVEYIYTDEFLELNNERQILVTDQLAAMVKYLTILINRHNLEG